MFILNVTQSFPIFLESVDKNGRVLYFGVSKQRSFEGICEFSTKMVGTNNYIIVLLVYTMKTSIELQLTTSTFHCGVCIFSNEVDKDQFAQQSGWSIYEWFSSIVYRERRVQYYWWYHYTWIIIFFTALLIIRNDPTQYSTCQTCLFCRASYVERT